MTSAFDDVVKTLAAAPQHTARALAVIMATLGKDAEWGSGADFQNATAAACNRAGLAAGLPAVDAPDRAAQQFWRNAFDAKFS